MSQFENTIIQNRDVAELYNKGLSGEKLDKYDQVRFDELMSSWFNHFDNFHYQYKKELIDDELWITWKKTFMAYLEKKGPGSGGKKLKVFSAKGFKIWWMKQSWN